MRVSEAAAEHLHRMLRRRGPGYCGFRFAGAVGSCRVSKPILAPVREPVAGAREFRCGDLVVYAGDDYAEVLEHATFEYDDAVLFGRGLTVSWPHREGGCPNCR